MKKTLTFLIGLTLSQAVFAENLIQVYEQARETNPDLRSSLAEREKAYSAISGSRASLLPQVGLNASYGVTHGRRDISGQKNKSGNLYQVTVSQSIFNFSSWKALDITKKQASIADIAYQYQGQTLILNTSVAYFNVLKALDALSFIDAQKEAIGRQLEQTRQQHQVGLVAITDVQNAQANYDLTVAQQVNALNELNNSIENLRQVSGRFYSSLATIDTKTFKTEEPTQINALLKQSETSNLNLLTMKLNQDIAREQIKLAQSGYMPTASIDASTNLNKNERYGSYSSNGAIGSHHSKSYSGNNYVGVSVNMPIFSGGATMSQVEQAQHNFVSYSEKLESTNRSVINQVRSSYNNIASSISSIRAYQQAVVSAESSLEATSSGYQVGTRTIVDVLNATTQLYSSKRNLSDAKYNYLTSLLQLKYAIGTLTADDLVYLNNMLGKELSTLATIK
ncbi:outer membrane channel protein TolC [Gilliamella sp. B14448G11]|uniref:outer membrane channel protein TolC n=1 Tax=unclassified Gilliamella TaxID=2685620 RepID=UPI0018DBEA05|nr:MULTISPECIES: outer membrane channel protein TolC [unclassified Gilliamella]MBI0027569.1 outer membrane channel protein TolC [Gilliamella sp. B14448G7]MBI0030009.1 outer membrane channel protein TolC [Gilliamella sp. B14384G15]MBI0034939.1 outer membrane channel protein TolC [Gilliamella sp. B14448G11]MBI0041393.1 outer membrane channel protein TolC [Gilliamella sp. B14448G12]MBI0057165.1 outer membrane channel protein TolC [Gilliamella sp. B14384G12]